MIEGSEHVFANRAPRMDGTHLSANTEKQAVRTVTISASEVASANAVGGRTTFLARLAGSECRVESTSRR